MPNPHEVAVLKVGSMVFHDWETVYVQHRWQGGWPTFRFSAAEGAEQPFDYAKLQFKPTDRCTILLGGALAVTGIITQRQVAYSAMEHGVQLSGVGMQWLGATSSVPSENNQNKFDNMTVAQIFNKVIASVGASGEIIGVTDPVPFPVMQSKPGELVWDFLDMVAREKNATLGSDHYGNLLLIGQHAFGVNQELIEGKNILKMQAVFSIEQMYGIYKLTGQFRVEENRSMNAVADIRVRAYGAKNIPRMLEYVTEHPNETPAEAQKRINYEALQRDGTQLTCHVTVQGWLRDGKNLWRCGDNVAIHSPMVPVNLGMKIKTATFTQDSKGGTITLLECVLPWMIGDQLYRLHPPAAGTVTPDPTSQDEQKRLQEEAKDQARQNAENQAIHSGITY
jgi:prophage tail gpP-like protein